MATAKRQRTCPNGHRFMKSSDCPTCPVCEAEKKPARGFLSHFSAPAQRALQNAGIRDVRALAKHTKKSLLALHGIGPASLPAMELLLSEAGLAFRVEVAANKQPKAARPRSRGE